MSGGGICHYCQSSGCRCPDDLIDRWHKGEGNDASIHEWLGMSLEQYKVFALHPRQFFRENPDYELPER